VLYEIDCSVSGRDDLWHSLGKLGGEDVTLDIGYSSPVHIVGELKRAITAGLASNARFMAKVRKYRPEPR